MDSFNLWKRTACPLPLDDYERLRCQTDHLRNFESDAFNVRDGLRVTPGQPRQTESTHRLCVFGGSTVICSEVSDAETLPAQIQSRLNELGYKITVENWGAWGASFRNRIAWLGAATVQKSDWLVFWIGANDCGWKHHQSRYPVSLVLYLGRRLHGVLTYLRATALRDLYSSLIYAPLLVRTAFKEFLDNCRLLGKTNVGVARTIIVLQPSRCWSAHRESEVARGNHLYAELVIGFYERVQRHIAMRKGLDIEFVDLSHIPASERGAVFLDDCHLTAYGNSRLGRQIADVLVTTGG